MPFTLADYAAELVGYIPKLDPILAETIVNRAWEDIRQERPWTFLIEDGALFAPDVVSDGAVTVTQFATTAQVVGDATASAAWAPLLLSTPPFTQRQFRIAGEAIYNILSVDNSNLAAIALTLDRMYLGATAAAQTYQIYRCYYSAGTDFEKWVSVFDPSHGYTLYPKRPYWDRAMLNRIDTYRTSQGLPIRLVPYKVDDTLGPLYEMWPHPTTAQGYPATWWRKGVDLATDESLPPAIPATALQAKSKMRAAEWAIMNSGMHPELRGVDWRLLMGNFDKDYKERIAKAKVRDENTFLQNFVIPRNNLYPQFPLDAKWLQSHDPIG